MTHLGSWELDLLADRLTCSEATCHLIGRHARDLGAYQDFLAIIHADDRAAVDEAFSESLRSGRDADGIEHRIRRADNGAVRVVLDSWVHQRNESGQVIRSVGIMQDVTERRQAERRQKRLLSILDHRSDFILVFTPERQLTYVNRSGRRLLGWKEDEELGGRAVADVYPTWALRIVEHEGIPTAVEQGVWSGESAVMTATGREIPVSHVITSHRSAEGSLECLSAVARDISSHELTESALRASEARFELAMRGANEGLWDWNLETDEVYYSPRWKGMLGYAEHEIGNRMADWERLLHPDDRERALDKVRAYLKGQTESYDSEFRMRHKDGHDVDILARGFGVCDASGKIVRLVGTHVDATELKRTEHALRKEMERYERLEENIPGMVYCYALHPDGSVSFPYVNAGSRELFGLEPEDLMRDPTLLSDLIHPDDRERRDQSIGKTAETLQPWRQELRHVVGGEVRWHDCMARPQRQPNGDVVCDGIILEITDHKRAEEALRLTQFSVDRAADAAFWIGPDARFQYANEIGCRLLGYTRDELLRMTVHDVNPEFPPEAWPEHWNELKRRGSMVIESLNQAKDGRLIPVEIAINFLEFEGREYNVAFTRDITERKQAEEEREKLEAQLRQSQKMEAIGQLAGGVAHDFNNILTAILGNVELGMESVRDVLGPDHGVLESMMQIEEAAHRASVLTRQLLTFSRRDVIRPQALNLNQTLAGLNKMLRRLVTEDILLDVITDAELRSVWADAGRMEQVIVNLVVNAVHAMPDGGRLTLETRNTFLDENYTRTHAEVQSRPHVLLAVSDTGQGMDAETRERVFEPFFTTKPADQGTGLGLATVHGIVKQSGGHITVYSEPGRGTSFKVYLPAGEQAPAEQTPAPQHRAAPGGNETILLCEDDEPVRGLIAETLREAGYRVITASHGQEALAAAEAHAGPLSLLITDVIMPDMNGRVVSDRLSAVRPDVRTLFISGYTSNIIAHHGVLNEGIGFLEKPFTRRRLLSKVRTVLDETAADS